MTKADITKLGVQLHVPLMLTSACYQPSGDGVACGKRAACFLRIKGCGEAGYTEPIPYQREE